MANRLHEWRDFMFRFSQNDVQGAVDSGFYVSRPWCSLAACVSRRGADPFCVFLSGGSGSGKTTELLVARDHLWLSGVPSVYVDASLRLDVSDVRGDRLLDVVASAAPRGAGGVVLVDGLDRAGKVDVDGVRRSVGMLRMGGTSVVLAVSSDPKYGHDGFARRCEPGPGRIHLGFEGGDLPGDVDRAFLREVLRVRDEHGRVTGAASDRLIDVADGRVRTFVAATCAAGQEAYMSGDDVVGLREADLVAQRLEAVRRMSGEPRRRVP